MIPAVTKMGRGFKGAWLYYLHDKNALTDDRVEFTHTLNLATDDPAMAWKIMSFTSMHQTEIKRAAGTPLTGRKNTQPVYAYSLSWHPEEQPTKEEMIEAGLQSLKTLDITNNEVVMVAHNDEEHPHLHLIVNRVDPETGIAAKLKKDYQRLQEWAHGYDLERDKVYCQQRAENIERRKNGEYVRAQGNLSKAEFHRWLRQQTDKAFEQREKDTKHLSEIHKKQRKELSQTRRKDLDQQWKKQKEHHRPQWGLIFKQQDNDRKALRKAQHHAWTRLSYYLKNRNQFRREPGSLDGQRGVLSGAFNAIISGKRLSDELDKKHKRERKGFGRLIKNETDQALKQINKDYSKHFDHLKNMQHDERHLMKTRHADQSKDAATDLTTGKAEKEFYRLAILKEFFDAKKNIQEKDIYREYADHFLKKKSNKGRDKTIYRDYWKNVLEEQKVIEQDKSEKRRKIFDLYKKTGNEVTRDRAQEKKEKGHEQKREDFRKTGEQTTRDKPAERRKTYDLFTKNKEDITHDKEKDINQTDEETRDTKDSGGRKIYDLNRNKGKGRDPGGRGRPPM